MLYYNMLNHHTALLQQSENFANLQISLATAMLLRDFKNFLFSSNLFTLTPSQSMCHIMPGFCTAYHICDVHRVSQDILKGCDVTIPLGNVILHV